MLPVQKKKCCKKSPLKRMNSHTQMWEYYVHLQLIGPIGIITTGLFSRKDHSSRASICPSACIIYRVRSKSSEPPYFETGGIDMNRPPSATGHAGGKFHLGLFVQCTARSMALSSVRPELSSLQCRKHFYARRGPISGCRRVSCPFPTPHCAPVFCRSAPIHGCINPHCHPSLAPTLILSSPCSPPPTHPHCPPSPIATPAPLFTLP